MRAHVERSWATCVAITALFMVSTYPADGFATDGQLTLTVTPPLFQLNLRPGETWTSGITVVNGNPYDLTVFAEPKLFRPTGEEGRPEFTDPPSGDVTAHAPDPTTLAGWITVPQAGIEIPREQTVVVPLAIDVPADAQPGGHYAAILIGTRPPRAPSGGTVSVASSIASLIVLRVAGDVDERGRVREFSTERSFYESPDARFTLRFENQGNVHLQPKGDITIYNMFGKKRGFIAVNQSGSFGNVLPGSIRRFDYAWSSDAGPWDIGRYRAEATIAYGEEAKSFANATVYFYVVPLIPAIEIVGAALFFLAFALWAVRAYVRRALAIETAKVRTTQEPAGTCIQSMPAHSPQPTISLRTLVRPIREGMIDLRSVAGGPRNTPSDAPTNKLTEKAGMTLGVFLRRYALFFAFVTIAAVGWVLASAYFADVLTYERAYDVKEVRGGEADNVP